MTYSTELRFVFSVFPHRTLATFLARLPDGDLHLEQRVFFESVFCFASDLAVDRSVQAYDLCAI